VRYRIAGESKVRLRLYRHTKNSQEFTELTRCGKVMCHRLVAYLFQKNGGRNPQFRPPFDWGVFANREALELGKDPGKSQTCQQQVKLHGLTGP
jgi:hypothetical protein